MATLRERLPERQDLLLVFGVVAFPIFAWAILQSFRELPSWLLRLSLWDVIGVASYIQAFALVETMLAYVALLALLVILPARIVDGRHVLFAAVTVATASGAAVGIHYADETLRQWGWLGISAVSAGILALALSIFILAGRSQTAEEAIIGLSERLALLSLLYVGIGVVGVLIIVVRNLWI